MTFNEYQAAARSMAQYPEKDDNIAYPSLKLCGEAGEVAEKVGKLMRNHGLAPYDVAKFVRADPAVLEAIKKELGDVLWYVSDLASVLGVPLEDVATSNIAKLTDRQQRGVIKSSGDDR
jgi:NTP pyrophosphatase (non-canonical NTP hydrolase)